MEELGTAITLNECANDGSDIHLYFNPKIGFYTAYGLSAYIADHIVEGPKSFSDEYQMPVMIIAPGEVLSLRSATEKVQHMQHEYYHFKSRSMIGTEGYAKWVKSLKK